MQPDLNGPSAKQRAPPGSLPPELRGAGPSLGPLAQGSHDRPILPQQEGRDRLLHCHRPKRRESHPDPQAL